MNRRDLLRNLFEQTYCRLRPSPIHGIGVFAIRPIPAGVDPFEGCYRGLSTKLREADLVGMDPAVREMVRDYFVLWEGDIWACTRGLNAIDVQYYLNHSDNPDMVTLDGGSHFLAGRDVEVGEELTVDYDSSTTLRADRGRGPAVRSAPPRRSTFRSTPTSSSSATATSP